MIRLSFGVLLFLAALLMSETIGPFTSTAVTGVAPSCNSPLVFQRFPSAAFGSRVYLAVWSDGERGTERKSSDIYCARIDSATGQTLDPNGILVCNADYHQSHPAIAFDGTNFLVVWEDFRSGKDYDVYAARVNESGQVLDPNGFAVSAIRDSNEARPRVAFANGNYLIAWVDARRYPAYGIFATRVSTLGQVLDPNGIVVSAPDLATLASKVPKDPKQTYASLTPYGWWDAIPSYYSVSMSASGNSCYLAWVKLSSMFWNYKDLMACKIDPATGSFVIAPKRITSTGRLVQDVAGHCTTPQGIALGVEVACPGWASTPNFFCQRFDTALTTKDSLLMPGGYCDKAQPRGYFFSLDGGTANVVRGQTSQQQFTSAYDGKNIVNALEGYWWKTTAGDAPLATGILLMRSSLTQDTLLDLTAPIRVDEVSVPRGTASTGSVYWPFLVSGPNNTVLLLYEKNYGIDNRQVVSRILREN